MPRVIQLTGIIDDGNPAPTPLRAPPIPTPIQAGYGEGFTIHLLVFDPSGVQVFATPQKVITYGASTQPLPIGQQLFQHIAVVSPVGDGAWDCEIVPHDYANVPSGAGRFPFSVWLTDNTQSPPQSNPVQALAQFIVVPSAINVSGPSTAPVPQQIVAYGLPLSGPSGYVLQALGPSGGLSGVAWAPLPLGPTATVLPVSSDPGIIGAAYLDESDAINPKISQIFQVGVDPVSSAEIVTDLIESNQSVGDIPLNVFVRNADAADFPNNGIIVKPLEVGADTRLIIGVSRSIPNGIGAAIQFSCVAGWPVMIQWDGVGTAPERNDLLEMSSTTPGNVASPGQGTGQVIGACMSLGPDGSGLVQMRMPA